MERNSQPDVHLVKIFPYSVICPSPGNDCGVLSGTGMFWFHEVSIMTMNVNVFNIPVKQNMLILIVLSLVPIS